MWPTCLSQVLKEAKFWTKLKTNFKNIHFFQHRKKKKQLHQNKKMSSTAKMMCCPTTLPALAHLSSMHLKITQIPLLSQRASLWCFYLLLCTSANVQCRRSQLCCEGILFSFARKQAVNCRFCAGAAVLEFNSNSHFALSIQKPLCIQVILT